MKIEIDFDGSVAKCTIQDTFNKTAPLKVVDFNDADKMSQIFALNAFRIIEHQYKKINQDK